LGQAKLSIGFPLAATYVLQGSDFPRDDIDFRAAMFETPPGNRRRFKRREEE
jgi:hypothetical protein